MKVTREQRVKYLKYQRTKYKVPKMIEERKARKETYETNKNTNGVYDFINEWLFE